MRLRPYDTMQKRAAARANGGNGEKAKALRVLPLPGAEVEIPGIEPKPPNVPPPTINGSNAGTHLLLVKYLFGT